LLSCAFLPSHKLYHNPSLRLTTKVKARQGMQIKKMFSNLSTFHKCEKVSPNTSKWIPTLGIRILECFELFLELWNKKLWFAFCCKIKKSIGFKLFFISFDKPRGGLKSQFSSVPLRKPSTPITLKAFTIHI
jgi:hypothetical protein